MQGRAGGVSDLTHCAFTQNQMTWHLDDYRCSVEVRGSFQETVPRKTTENTVKHRDGGVGSVVANHCNGGKSSVVITTLVVLSYSTKFRGKGEIPWQQVTNGMWFFLVTY